MHGFMRHRSGPSRSGPLAGLIGLVLMASAGMPGDVQAQRPFDVFDPFYRSETARRVFYDDFALTGELSYRASGIVQNNGLSLTGGDPFGLSFRLDYRLAPRLDLSAYWDTRGTSTARSVIVSWVGLKYYWHVENTDYALRLAVDPSSDGRAGFPQMDFAFLSTRVLSPVFSNDVAIGLRHVRMRFQQVVQEQPEDDLHFLNTQALGLEMHLMWSYDLVFDPASSNVFISLVGEGGQYSMLDSPLFLDPSFQEPVPGSGASPLQRQYYRGGVVWMRSGLEYNRPAYQFIPFLSLPLKQWQEENWQEANLQFGFRLMVR